jgi:hypothetical protein
VNWWHPPSLSLNRFVDEPQVSELDTRSWRPGTGSHCTEYTPILKPSAEHPWDPPLLSEHSVPRKAVQSWSSYQVTHQLSRFASCLAGLRVWVLDGISTWVCRGEEGGWTYVAGRASAVLVRQARSAALKRVDAIMVELW